MMEYPSLTNQQLANSSVPTESTGIKKVRRDKVQAWRLLRIFACKRCKTHCLKRSTLLSSLALYINRKQRIIQEETSPIMASTTQSPSPSNPTSSKSQDRHHANLAALPEARQQSYEELYGPPENLLEIEVSLRFCAGPSVCSPTHSAVAAAESSVA